MNKLKRIKQVRIHHEGNHTLVGSALFLIMCCAVAYAVGLPDFVFYALVALSIAVYAVILNFFRCPKRRFQGDTADVVVAPADGKVVVNEEVEENEYFGDRRRMVSIFMSLVNVHANWFPVDGYVTRVEHQNGNFHMASESQFGERTFHCDNTYSARPGDNGTPGGRRIGPPHSNLCPS